MKSITHFVGIDYHQATIQVCVIDEKGKVIINRSLPNDPLAVDQAVREYKATTIRAGIEACNGATNFAQELKALGWFIDLAHPGYVARMKQTPDKSDKTDAFVLADLCRVGYLPVVWLPPVDIQVLRELVHHRQGLVKDRTAIKLRIRALLRKHRINSPHTPWSRPWFAWLQTGIELSEDLKWTLEQDLLLLITYNQRIEAVTQRLTEKTKHNPVLQYLQEQRGFGFITAVTIYAEIGDFRRFTNGKQLANFCGLTPKNNSTGGKDKTGGLIGERNRDLRSVLIEAGHRLVRHDERWRTMLQHLRSRGKKYNVAVAAVANRWIRKLFYTLRDFQNNLANEHSRQYNATGEAMIALQNND